ncbi:aminopeptidase P family protein [Streptantibioticus parmotrematis]|nr:aminopeptidase P family protein [Streptantibioticus parmotrematis]
MNPSHDSAAEVPDTAAYATGSHDLPVSPALSAFMGTGWEPTPLPDTGASAVTAWTAARRALLAERFPGERIVIPAGREKTRSNDMPYPFRPHTAYTYLTGDRTPDGVLVMEPDGAATLCLRPRSAREGEAFRDRVHGEFWVGRRPTLGEAGRMLRIPVAELRLLPDLLGGARVPTRVLRGVDAGVDELLPGPPDAELLAALSELRLRKSPWEVDELRKAVDITVRGFEDVAGSLAEATRHRRGERWVEGVFGHRARLEGNGVGYGTIAAAGEHACTLHWTRNDGPLRPGELLLLDAGVETDTLYTADITRTLPISGTFTPLQRDLYALEFAAQDAGIAALKPGARFRDFHLAAMRVIVGGLIDLGIVRTGLDEAMDAGDGRYRRYTLCASGHMLGMDVHDCAQARAGAYLDAPLEAGHVLTVEPGVYFQPDDLTVPEELRGIGIRLEDDLVITPSGAELLSAALPRSPGDVEAWLGGLMNGTTAPIR